MAAGRRKRVLIVDRDPDVAATVGELLEVDGYEVTIITRLAEALAALRSAAYDIVLTDRVLTADAPEGSVLIATDSPGPFRHPAGIPVLLKPFRLSDFRAVVGGVRCA